VALPGSNLGDGIGWFLRDIGGVRAAGRLGSANGQTDGARLTFEALMRPEIRAAADRCRPAARRQGRVPHHQRRTEGARGFFTRDERGAVVGVDLAGRLFTRVPTAAQ
jgi:hypothetical protein